MGLGLSIQIEREGWLSKRAWNEMQRESWSAVSDRWEKKILPLHFQPFAAAKYGYQQRAASTKKRKRRDARRGRAKKGGSVALVHSGLLEEQMRRSGISRVFPTRFTLVKPAANYVTNRPRNGRPNMVAEITKVIPSEERQLARIFEKTMIDRLARARNKTTKKLGAI